MPIRTLLRISATAVLMLVCTICGRLFVNPASNASEPNTAWELLSDAPNVRTLPSCFELGGNIYCLGGFTPDSFPRALDKYEIRSDDWANIGATQFSSGSAYSAIIGQQVFYTAGLGPDGWVTNHLFVYDLLTGATDTLPGYGSLLHSGKAVNDEGRFRMLGGHNGLPIDFNIVFDPSDSSWITENPLPVELERHGVAVYGDEVHILGGRGSDGETANSHWVYSTVTNTFALAEPLPIAVKDPGAATIGRFIIVCGGRLTNTDYTNAVQLYDTENHEWLTFTSLPRDISFGSAVPFGNSVYLIGGYAEYQISLASTYRLNLATTAMCCVGNTGNIDCDPYADVNVADLTMLIDHLFIGFGPLCCPAEANTDGDPLGVVDISDLTHLIDHLFISFEPTESCQ